MSLDIYEGVTRRLSISQDDFEKLEESQRELKGRAGRTLDPYATSQLEPAHARLWLEGLRRVLPSLRTDQSASRACEEIVALLADAIARGVTLTLEGD
jgi:hypothetical protein